MTLTVQEIVENVRLELARSNSPIASFNNHSSIGAVINAFATVINTQENKLDGVYANLFLTTTSGEDLDLRAFDYGLARLQGRKASGSILIRNLTSNLPRNTILTEPTSNIQYKLLSDVYATNITNQELVGIVESVEPGSIYNLQAGVTLVSSLYPNASIVVGSRRNSSNNSVEGSLVNGTDSETDEELKFRIKEFLRTPSQSTPQSIVNALDGISGTGRIFLVEHTPVTGYFTVYVETRDLKVIEAIDRTLEIIKPAGVVGLVKSLEQRNIDISAVITIADSSAVPNLRSMIRTAIHNYITSLTVADTVSVNAINRSINNVDNVISSVLTFPSANLVMKDNQLPSLGKLLLRFIVS